MVCDDQEGLAEGRYHGGKGTAILLRIADCGLGKNIAMGNCDGEFEERLRTADCGMGKNIAMKNCDTDLRWTIEETIADWKSQRSAISRSSQQEQVCDGV